MAMITTVQQHILQQQQEQLKASGREPSGTFSWLLSGITLAAKMVEAKIRSAGLSDVYGAFVLSNERMREQRSYYSVNEANAAGWPTEYREYLEKLKTGGLGKAYSSRYIGSLVADFHRTLLKGGVFLYPPTLKQLKGKLRLLYEANPLAFIAEQAGGMATNGASWELDIKPEAIHQRTPFCVGGVREMTDLVEAVGR